MNTNIASGTINANKVYVAVGGTAKAHDAADATNPRYDVLCVGSNGTVDIVKGTAATTPVIPATTADHVRIAIIYIGAGETAIHTADITDARIIIPKTVEYLQSNTTEASTTSESETWDNS
jgi:hypothetical protein